MADYAELSIISFSVDCLPVFSVRSVRTAAQLQLPQVSSSSANGPQVIIISAADPATSTSAIRPAQPPCMHGTIFRPNGFKRLQLGCRSSDTHVRTLTLTSEIFWQPTTICCLGQI